MSVRWPTVQLDTDELPSGPWIFGRSVREAPGVEDGALVEILDRSGRFIGHGLYNAASDIRLRVLSRARRTSLDRPREFLLARLRSADRLRRRVLRLPEVADCWRVAHAEGDDLPGLIVDKLGPVLVAEHHSLGFWRLRSEVEAALGELYPGHPVVHRVPPSAARAEGFEPEATGADAGEVLVHEHGLAFPVLPGMEHKTGWFCDQRDNRQLAAGLARGLDVLDLCCNAGGFALHAKRAGARNVVAVDLDEKALRRAGKAAELNALDVRFVHADAFDVLRAEIGKSRRPDLIVLDPHKIVRSRKDLEEGTRRYLDLNALAMRAVAPGGLLFTFSCSGALELGAFLGILFQAGRRAERPLRLLQVVGASPDHPQRPEFPRSRYLKGALLAVDG